MFFDLAWKLSVLFLIASMPITQHRLHLRLEALESLERKVMIDHEIRLKALEEGQ